MIDNLIEKLFHKLKIFIYIYITVVYKTLIFCNFVLVFFLSILDDFV